MADPVKFRETIRKRGRKISPEAIQAILDALGPGVIKSVIGVGSGLFGVLKGKSFIKGGKPSSRVIEKSKTQENLPVSKTGLRRNIGGRRPPDTELEALAIRKQQAQKIAKEDRAMRKEGIKKRTKMFEEEGGVMELSPDILKKAASDTIKNIKRKKLKDEERLRKLLEDAFKGSN